MVFITELRAFSWIQKKLTRKAISFVKLTDLCEMSMFFSRKNIKVT